MMRNIKIGRFDCDCFTVDSPHICYILTPLRLDAAKLSEYSVLHNASIVSVTGIDWDDDLTPWPANGVERGDADFKGYAAAFLRTLCKDVIPRIESDLRLSPTVMRSLIGISLSGLFAVWAWMQGNTFHNIASISGSFWYDGFTRWFSHLSMPQKPGCAYFSLGDKEGGSKGSPRFSSVASDTAMIINLLDTNNVSTMFEQTQGTHYAPIYPRLEKAFAGLENMVTLRMI